MISIIMGMHKIDNYAFEAIESLFMQTFSNYELLVIANGPERKFIESELLTRYKNETRLKIIKCEIAQLSNALNMAIEEAQYQIIARMDADDVARPDRLEKQFNHMNKYGLDMLGCDLGLIDSQGFQIGQRTYPKGKNIDRWLPFRNCFAHNTILIKKSVIVAARGYNAGFNTEDYDLWLRLKRMGIKWDNMNAILLDYRIHDGSSQRKLLGYAEATGLAMREFILKKNVINFFALLYHFLKSLLRARNSA